jgi:hypothetical protein
MSRLSKQDQLRGGSDQAMRRAARAGKRYKPGETNGPASEDALAEWEQATVQGRALLDAGIARWGTRFIGVCAQIGERLHEQGVLNTRKLSGRNAVAVARIADDWLQDVERASSAANAQSKSTVQQRSERASTALVDAASALSEREHE